MKGRLILFVQNYRLPPVCDDEAVGFFHLDMREQRITDFLHSRYGFMLMALMSVAAAGGAYIQAPTMAPGAGWGPLMFSFAEWFSKIPPVSLAVAVALNFFIALLLIYINKHYNVLRSISYLFAGLFLVMEAALPTLFVHMSDGIFIAVVVLLSLIPLYTTFQDSERTRRVFLSFCIVSAGALVDITCAAYLIALFVGCFQMRCITLRTMLAAVLGIITPWWIAWGTGALSVAAIRLPEFVSLFSVLEVMKIAQVLVYAGTSLALGIGFGMFNLLKIYSYNARTRAYNGFLVVLAITTVALMVVDYNRLVIYLPMLNVCTAIQMGHFFIINRRKRSYIPVICVIGIYAVLYLWALSL